MKKWNDIDELTSVNTIAQEYTENKLDEKNPFILVLERLPSHYQKNSARKNIYLDLLICE